MKRILIALLITQAAYGFNNFKVWEKTGCFFKTQFNYPDKTNPALLQAICSLVNSEEEWRFFWHSDGRPPTTALATEPVWRFWEHQDLFSPLSLHAVFNAVDFHLSDYNGLGKLDRLLAFKGDVEKFELYLKKTNLTDAVGFGIYPDQNNPFFHLDFRGRRARWGRVGRNYVGIDFAKEWLDEQIDLRRQP